MYSKLIFLFLISTSLLSLSKSSPCQSSSEPNNFLLYHKEQGVNSHTSNEQSMYNSFLAALGTGYNNFGTDTKKEFTSIGNNCGDANTNNNRQGYTKTSGTFDDYEKNLRDAILLYLQKHGNGFAVETKLGNPDTNVPNFNYDEFINTLNNEHKTIMNTFLTNFGTNFDRHGHHSSTGEVDFVENNFNRNQKQQSTASGIDDVLHGFNQERLRNIFTNLFGHFEGKNSAFKTYREEKTSATGTTSTFQGGFNLFDQGFGSNNNRQNERTALNHNGMGSSGVNCCRNGLTID